MATDAEAQGPASALWPLFRTLYNDNEAWQLSTGVPAALWPAKADSRDFSLEQQKMRTVCTLLRVNKHARSAIAL